jgi:hypothetical protein
MDEKEVSKIFIRYPEGAGVALAVQNRLVRAAAYRIVTL